MITCAACSNSPTSEDEQDKEAPDLGKFLKDMALIPAGDFMMGSKEGEGAFDEHPQHVVYLDDYYIDKYEVTNAQFKDFVEATGYVTDAERKDYGEVWNPKEHWYPWILRGKMLNVEFSMMNGRKARKLPHSCVEMNCPIHRSDIRH